MWDNTVAKKAVRVLWCRILPLLRTRSHRSHGHRLRLWAQDLQGVAGVVEVPSHSTLSKIQGWSSHFGRCGGLGQLELLGDEWVLREG